MSEKALTVIADDDKNIAAERANANTLLASIDEMKIDSDEMNVLASEMLSDLHHQNKKFKLFRDGIINPFKAALDNAKRQFSPIEDIFDTAIATLKRKMATYQNELRIKQEAADRAAAERDRIAREEAAAKLAATEDRFAAGEAEIEELEAAHADVQIADVTTTTVAAPVATKVGTGSGIEYKVSVVDLPALLDHIAADLRSERPRYTNTVTIKIAELKAFAKATKGEVAIPGCNIEKDTKIIAR